MAPETSSLRMPLRKCCQIDSVMPYTRSCGATVARLRWIPLLVQAKSFAVVRHSPLTAPSTSTDARATADGEDTERDEQALTTDQAVTATPDVLRLPKETLSPIPCWE